MTRQQKAMITFNMDGRQLEADDATCRLADQSCQLPGTINVVLTDVVLLMLY